MKAVKKLHARLILTGFHEQLPTTLAQVLNSYSLSASHFDDARRLFDQIRQPNIRLWNYMIRGCSQSHRPADAFLFYHRMCLAGSTHSHLTFIFLLKACERASYLRAGRGVHAHIVMRGFGAYLFVANALIHMYAFCGGLEHARDLLDCMPERDIVSWNSLICGYAHNGRMEEVLKLFKAMQAQNVIADSVTLVKVVLACSLLGNSATADEATQYIEEHSVKIDTYLGNALIDLYGRRGSVESAKRVFDQMLDRNLVTYNAMIVSNAKAGNLVAARRLFDEMPERDVISWTSLICGYSQARQSTNALALFSEMMQAKVKPDELTVASVLSACAHSGALHFGESIHHYIRKHIKADVYVGNSLVDMYCKCGCIGKALEVFNEMKEKDTVTWTSLIVGMAVNGFASDALKFFSQMVTAGVKPSDVTFIGVLLACSHNGLVDEGFEYFKSMRELHHIEPEMKHYGCVVDLLSRFGYLDRAYELISNMHGHPDPVLWRSLLSACRQYGNVYLAEVVTKKLLELDPKNSGNYVLMSNTYAGSDRWDDAMMVREMMEKNNVQKSRGCSSLEVNSVAEE